MPAVMRHLVGLVRAGASRAGYRIQRRDAPLHTPADLGRVVRAAGLSPRTVFDVGVAHGTPELYEGFPEAHFVLVEPVREYVGELEGICRGYSAEYVLAAALDRAGEIEIRIGSDARKSSVVGSPEKTPPGTAVARTVPTVRIDDLRRERRLDGPVAIKADVEGAELLALDGARETLEETELVILEVSLWGKSGTGAELAEVVAYMAARGFVAYDIVGAAPREGGGLADVDMAFVRRDGPLR